jgi:hypothetical protein
VWLVSLREGEAPSPKEYGDALDMLHFRNGRSVEENDLGIVTNRMRIEEQQIELERIKDPMTNDVINERRRRKQIPNEREDEEGA